MRERRKRVGVRSAHAFNRLSLVTRPSYVDSAISIKCVGASRSYSYVALSSCVPAGKFLAMRSQ